MISYAQDYAERSVTHMSELRDWLLGLPARGRYTFTTDEASNSRVSEGAKALSVALYRAGAAGLIRTPVRGFHVVLPLEDRARGQPSWRLFLDPMMAYLSLPYYVGLLTAAAHHGASGQAAQVVQVVVPRQRRPTIVGQLRVEYVVSRAAADAPVELVNTPSGRFRVATRELTALDLVRYPARSGGWGNVATVIRDLAPRLNGPGMKAALATDPRVADAQRLGHLLERAGADVPASVIERWLEGRSFTWVPLVPGSGRAGDRSERWRLIVNAQVEPD